MKEINPVARKPKSYIWTSSLVVNPLSGTIDRIMPSGKVREDIGCLSRGYKKASINGKVVPLQRIIWSFMYGEPDEGMIIDHINGNRSDNRIDNLRLVTPSQNTQNQHKPRKDNLSSGIKGVTLYKPNGTWQAQIRAHGKYYYIGRYKTKEEAAEAYKEGAKKYHTHNPIVNKG